MTKLQDFLNSPITAVSKIRAAVRAGDLFGIELECEGRNVDWDGSAEGVLTDWVPHADGSLRNNHGSSCEWVFNGPVKYDTSVKRIDTLFDYFQKRRATLVTSNRTSTHIHYNMGDKNVYQLVNLFIVFTILEDLLGRYCGPDRNGNLFCLSSRHAEEQVRWMTDSCFKTYTFNFREDWRYCAMNVASINKFGTVEFRGMRGLDNKQDILDWLDIVNELCEYACYKMHNPVTLVETISAKTPLGFLKDVFSKKSISNLTEGLEGHEVNSSIYEGLRLVQMLSYRIGTEFNQVRLRGRDFWASFEGDAEPIKDIEPANIREPKKAARPDIHFNPFRQAEEGHIARARRVIEERQQAQAEQQPIPQPPRFFEARPPEPNPQEDPAAPVGWDEPQWMRDVRRANENIAAAQANGQRFDQILQEHRGIQQADIHRWDQAVWQGEVIRGNQAAKPIKLNALKVRKAPDIEPF